MKILITTLILSFITFSSILDKNDFVGLWQAPKKAVWIKINQDNSVYQCRIDRDKSVISSNGVLKGNIIYWERIWGKDTIERKDNFILLSGRFGKFKFEKAINDMHYTCKGGV